MNKSRDGLIAMFLEDHKWKIDGLARLVLSKPSKEARRKFIAEFEHKHGVEMSKELQDKILELHKQSRLSSPPTNQSG